MLLATCLVILTKLLRGPEAAAAATAVTAAGGLRALLALLDGRTAIFAAKFLLAFTGTRPTSCEALIAAGAVPRVLEALASAIEGGGGENFEGEETPTVPIARTLLNLMRESASVAAEATAAGFDAARLRRLTSA